MNPDRYQARALKKLVVAIVAASLCLASFHVFTATQAAAWTGLISALAALWEPDEG